MQNREPPSYQEYAPSVLSAVPFRAESLTQRGLHYTLKLELWVNKTLPADPNALARVLGLDAGDVAAALPHLAAFFTFDNGEIRCPELDDYRAHLEARHQKQSEGGKAGARIANAARGKSKRRKNGANKGIPDGAATPTADSTATPAASGRLLSTVQSSEAQSKPPLRKEISPDPFVAEYDSAQRTECSEAAYRAKSRGE